MEAASLDKTSGYCMCAPAAEFLTAPSGEPTNNRVTQQLGIFDIFKIGIGPSSSHTVGPMVACLRFIEELKANGLFEVTAAVHCDLFGSLALTGVGHGTDKAVCAGLSGEAPGTVLPDDVESIVKRVKAEQKLTLAGMKDITFSFTEHITFHHDAEMPQHPNGMRLTACDNVGADIHHNEYFSVGGGFVQTAAEFEGHSRHFSGCISPVSTQASSIDISPINTRRSSLTLCEEIPMSMIPLSRQNSPLAIQVPYPFNSASQLVDLCRQHGLTIAELMMENERFISCDGSIEDVHRGLDDIWAVMWQCIERGKKSDGLMPVSGSRRQSPGIYRQLKAEYLKSLPDHFAIMDWITLFARCVNEENACGGRVVTAPTNGASGTLPAVLSYYAKFFHRATDKGIREFLATSAAFGALIKLNASISGAEAGCQAEVGSACAMSAAGLTAALGGTLEQVENAAEIGLEHNLGMTCDPVGGLVQVPCIERNCIAAIKAITAYRLAMRGDGDHEVSFDSCVETMYRTGLDMQAKYRETSTGGLALYARKSKNIPKGIMIRQKFDKSVSRPEVPL